jgi:hypothetical protein
VELIVVNVVAENFIEVVPTPPSGDRFTATHFDNATAVRFHNRAKRYVSSSQLWVPHLGSLALPCRLV